MALCHRCSTVIPCHCHLTPAVEIRPGIYVVTEPHPRRQDQPASDRDNEK